MKKILLTIAAIALFAAPVSAQYGTYSVWTDAEKTACDASGGAYAAFNIVLLMEPGPEGIFGAEFAWAMPPTVIFQGDPVYYGDICVSQGTLSAGLSLGFCVCQNDPFVIFSALVLPLSDAPGYLQVVEHPVSGGPLVASCIPDAIRPTYDGDVYNYFGWNASCQVGTEESSWGAIKSMMD